MFCTLFYYVARLLYDRMFLQYTQLDCTVWPIWIHVGNGLYNVAIKKKVRPRAHVFFLSSLLFAEPFCIHLYCECAKLSLDIKKGKRRHYTHSLFKRNENLSIRTWVRFCLYALNATWKSMQWCALDITQYTNHIYLCKRHFIWLYYQINSQMLALMYAYT